MVRRSVLVYAASFLCAVFRPSSLFVDTFRLPDQDGVTPLIEAVKNGHVEVVKALLDKGTSIERA